MRERDVIHQILDYLAVKHVFAFQLSTGTFYDSGRRFRSHSLGPGAADICCLFLDRPPVWIETKSPRGRQRDSQRIFQKWVESVGHIYVLARSIDDLAGIV